MTSQQITLAQWQQIKDSEQALNGQPYVLSWDKERGTVLTPVAEAIDITTELKEYLDKEKKQHASD